MIECRHSCIYRLGRSHEEILAFYRLLNNPKVRVESLIKSFQKACLERVSGRRVLVALDRTEYRYGHQKSRKDREDFGKMRHGWQSGFQYQVGLAIDRDEGFPLGLADVKGWARSRELPDKKERGYANQARDQKESRHWLNAIDRIGQATHSASEVTVVADCELDFFDFLSALEASRCDFVVRMAHNRRLAGADNGSKVFDAISDSEVTGRYDFPLPARKEKGRTKRTARMIVRCCKLQLRAPENADADQALAVNLLEVSEHLETVPADEDPIRWRLYTSHDLDSLDQCREVVSIYQKRWLIEQLFRTTKRKGMQIESSQIEKGENLQKLICLAIQASLSVMQLVQARDARSKSLPARLGFTTFQIKVLKMILPSVNGNTEKQKNPHPPQSLPWAAWIIGRLGGWKGLASQGPPGPISMIRGMQIFNNYTQMASIMENAKDMYKD